MRDSESESGVVEQSSNPVADQREAIAGDEKLVPVSEAIRYRRRAQTAEQQLEQLNAELAQMKQQLSEAEQVATALAS